MTPNNDKHGNHNDGSSKGRDLRIGLTIPQRGVAFGATTVDELLGLAGGADASGLFDSIWVGDSLTAKPRLDSLSLLGALAGVTQRVTLGVGCMASFAVRDPIVFAYQWASLDQISDGRMLLAVCTGIVRPNNASADEGSYWGVADRERAGRLEEHIDICRRLWSEDSVQHAGTYRTFTDLTIEPKPVQSPCPIWIAANPVPGRFYDRILRRIAQFADGWMSVQRSPNAYGDAWADLQDHLKGCGRDPDTFPTIAYHNVNIGPDRDQAWDESERFLTEYYGPVFDRAAVQAWTAAGTPEDCADALLDLHAQGADHITLRITSWNQRSQYKRLVDEVLPALSARVGRADS